MRLHQNPSCHLVLHHHEWLALGFTPVCHLKLGLTLPFIPGTRTVYVEFMQANPKAALPPETSG